MNYRLIAIDLDGTLVRSDQSISPRTIDTLRRAQQAGVKVAVASGRPTFGTAYAADALCLKELGGYVMSIRIGKSLSIRDAIDGHLFSFTKNIIFFIQI